MRSSIDGTIETAEKTYPYLGIWNDGETNFVVLFTQPGKGVCVYCNDNEHTVGGREQEWFENEFNHFSGEVTLAN